MNANAAMMAATAAPAQQSPVAAALPPAQPPARRGPARQVDVQGAPPPEVNMPALSIGFHSLAAFELGQRMARMLSMVDVIPDRYRARYKKHAWSEDWTENPNAVPNCFAALSMSQRMGVDVLVVMQNLYLVHGQPAWSGQFVIAMISAATDRFAHELQFDWHVGEGTKAVEVVSEVWEGSKGNRQKVEKKVTYHVPDMAVVAWTISRTTGKRIESAAISCEMAAREGWWGGNPKWQSMTQQMLMYRAGAWFGRVHCPDKLMGLGAVEEYGEVLEARPMPEGDGQAEGQGALLDQHVTADIDGRAEPETEAAASLPDESRGRGDLAPKNMPPRELEPAGAGFGNLS